ncbi:futalosine hydrolase [Streptomyces caniscabiei]|uniref:Futalosine hydrolase n=1 Tax=Streptomyces caniscabiei TaxID=2746961 RepID=A0A927QFE3_9ACTN|nr:futalosine hydrolase [Streptomyces caniscabiei]MBD9724948.1 futalosine hydrolase [Streptomyces caniscabiei]MDX3510481.1 futalosine hydrolase [Streptomyces caniscabiei]MDX3720564.1 futalosine hydrolase [Streptomyces caniscabiei]WEO26148.1 futalosine hydrolase [Streptomyces caniscabiei]
MRILVATAVPAERDAVARALPGPATETRLPAGTLHRHRVNAHTPDTPPSQGPSATGPQHTPLATGPEYDLLAAGVGPALAAASTAGALTAAVLEGRPYGLVVSAGIAGGFPPEAPLGSLVLADEITAADLGAETPAGFLPVTDLGFGTVTHRPPRDLVRAAATATGARTGTVLTVSTVTGSAERAAALRTRHPRALAEAMEGFGVAEAAAAHATPVLELRAVSNPVGPRDRAAWRIGDALTALTTAFGKLTPVLESWDPHEP